MRFLFIILSIVWIVYGWVAIASMQWRPPQPPPPHAEAALQQHKEDQLINQREQLSHIIETTQLDENTAAQMHFQLAYAWWLLAYHQDSRTAQLQSLQKSLKHCMEAAEIVPDNPSYVYSIADLYHQMGEYEIAETHYKEALRLDPEFDRARQRYKDLKREMQ